jgi:ABC-type Fe3+-hydroxamate transport system substrate-binding protein
MTHPAAGVPGAPPDPLVDAVGTRHVRAGDEARIVSIVPSITELLCDLGLADRLVARTGFCIHPRDTVRRIPKIGGTKDVDLDKLLALRPTHVIVNIDENRRETVDALRGHVPHIVVTHPLAPDDNVALYRLVGAIFSAEAAAESLVAQFQAALAAAQGAVASLARERVLYLIWRDPWMTVTRDTYVSRTLAVVGWDTMPERAEKRYPEVMLDAATLDGVASVMLSTEPYMFRERHVAELAAFPALAGRRVMLVDGEATSWYGSRAITGLGYLAQLRLRTA